MKLLHGMDGSKGAITYSFDDGCSGQLQSAIPSLNKYGLKATFNLVTNWVNNWGGWKQAAQSGHEIASHTVSHANLNAAGDNELSQSKQIIEQNIGQEYCISKLCYRKQRCYVKILYFW